MDDIMIVIPSLEPDARLLDLVKTIRSENAELELLIVDDGSGREYSAVFDQVKKVSYTQVIHHPINMGKGAAIKSAIKEILSNYPHIQWMVTIDSDGQHSYEDMMKTINLAKENPGALVLGTRQFDGEVPLRSRFGNSLTKNFFGLMTGIKLDDTQTGLRVIPRSFLVRLLEVKGDRFEYETNMLIEMKRQGWPILSQTIATTYLDDNASSHFRVIADSVSIYGVLLKYLLSSVSSFVVDIIVYTLLIYFLSQLNLSSIMVASVTARCVSSLFNYFVNRELVFEDSSNHSFLKYYALVIVQIILSGLLVYSIHQFTGFKDTIIVKVVVDSFLFIISFQVQKMYVFNRKGEV